MLISIHAARVGCDGETVINLPCRTAISIHAARVGCDLNDDEQARYEIISIHAAQEGCDKTPVSPRVMAILISIHAAQEGCDIYCLTCLMYRKKFQSTQPKRAATQRLKWVKE